MPQKAALMILPAARDGPANDEMISSNTFGSVLLLLFLFGFAVTLG